METGCGTESADAAEQGSGPLPSVITCGNNNGSRSDEKEAREHMNVRSSPSASHAKYKTDSYLTYKAEMKEKARRLSAGMKSKKIVRPVQMEKCDAPQEKRILRFYLSDESGVVKGHRVGNAIYLSPQGISCVPPLSTASEALPCENESSQDKNTTVFFVFSTNTAAGHEPGQQQDQVPVKANVRRVGMSRCDDNASQKSLPFIEFELTDVDAETSYSSVDKGDSDYDAPNITVNPKPGELRRSSRLRQRCDTLKAIESDEETDDGIQDDNGEGLTSPQSGSEYEVSQTNSPADEYSYKKVGSKELSRLFDEDAGNDIGDEYRQGVASPQSGSGCEASQANSSDDHSPEDKFGLTMTEVFALIEHRKDENDSTGCVEEIEPALNPENNIQVSDDPTNGELDLLAEPLSFSGSAVDESVIMGQEQVISGSNKADAESNQSTQCCSDVAQQLRHPTSTSFPDSTDDNRPSVDLTNIKTPAQPSRKRKEIISNDPKEKKQKLGGYDGSDILELVPRSEDETNIGKKGSFLKYVNILSWLIDAGVLSENEAVICKLKKKKKGPPLRGLVTRKGIRCNCCKKVISHVDFEAHVGRGVDRPWANICLLSGKSLEECQLEALDNECKKRQVDFQNEDNSGSDPSDDYCGLCGDGGDLICCDNCPSAFHQDCMLLKTIPEDHWYCPYCTCKFCKVGGQTSGLGSWATPLSSCSQCGHKYHLKCAWKNGMPWMSGHSAKFCTTSCQKIDAVLSDLVGVKNSIPDGFSWTLLRSLKKEGTCLTDQRLSSPECNIKLSLALLLLNECFYPVLDPQTGVEMLSQAVRSCRSKFNRLNCEGFYTAVLEKGEEMISVALLRVHGSCLAEIPLIGTRAMFRKQGMCQRLLSAVEGMISSVCVKRLIIPSIPRLREMWTNSFNFMPLESTLTEEMRSLRLMIFGQTTWLQKSIADGQSGNQEGANDSINAGNDTSEVNSSGRTTAAGHLPPFSNPKCNMETSHPDEGLKWQFRDGTPLAATRSSCRMLGVLNDAPVLKTKSTSRRALFSSRLNLAG